MPRQVIAQNWKQLSITYDPISGFEEKTKPFGRYTKQTAIDRVTKLNPGYTFREKPNHGFGGYWVNGNGDTIEIMPDYLK